MNFNIYLIYLYENNDINDNIERKNVYNNII